MRDMRMNGQSFVEVASRLIRCHMLGVLLLWQQYLTLSWGCPLCLPRTRTITKQTPITVKRAIGAQLTGIGTYSAPNYLDWFYILEENEYTFFSSLCSTSFSLYTLIPSWRPRWQRIAMGLHKFLRLPLGLAPLFLIRRHYVDTIKATVFAWIF